MIRNKNIFPPKGWLYRERIGTEHLNISDPALGFDQVVAAISNARKNNPSSGLQASYTACSEALVEFTCKRLNNDSRWCVTEKAQQQAIATKKKCAGCGRRKKKK